MSVFLYMAAGAAMAWQGAELPDIRSVAADLETPAVVTGEPRAGRRVRQTIEEWKGTEVHHALYLPRDWKRGRRYPVIVEYAGNGNYKNRYGDVSEGTVEGSNLGYGLSGGRGFVWISMPFVDRAEKRNAVTWWGDAEATVDYCRKAVRMVCEKWGGDPSAVVLAGFSRGAIACNYIGLRDDSIADIWLAFVPYSHYDGVRSWPYADSGRDAAMERLRRLKGRAVFLSHENSVEATREYLASTGVMAPFTIRLLPFRNHNDAWTLRDLPLRREARAWMEGVVRDKPGTHAISGRVTDARGRAVRRTRVQSGETHFTFTDGRGRYRLAGLIDSTRTVTAGGASRTVTVSGRDVVDVDLTLPR